MQIFLACPHLLPLSCAATRLIQFNIPQNTCINQYLTDKHPAHSHQTLGKSLLSLLNNVSANALYHNIQTTSFPLEYTGMVKNIHA